MVSSDDVRSVTDERGQLLIVGALVIAVVLVSIVLVLNGTMYVENVDGGSHGSAAVADAETVRSSVRQDLDRLTRYTADGEGYAGYDRLEDETNAYSGNYSRFAAGGGPASVSVSLNESASTEVTRIRDDGSGLRPPNDNHVLVTESEARDYDVRVVDFDLNFTVGDQFDFSGSDEFVLHVTDAATSDGGRDAEWTLSIDRASSGSGVEFETSGPSTCGEESLSDGDRIHIDIDDGEVEYADGTPICTFEFGAGVSAPYGVEIENRGRIGYNTLGGGEHGTYDLVLNEYVPDVEPRLASAFPSESFPDVFNATRTATYDFQYRSPSLDYEGQTTAEVPPRRVALLIDDFEDGSLSNWSPVGDGDWSPIGVGDSGVRKDGSGRGTVAFSGEHSAYIENTSSANGIESSNVIDTSNYDTVHLSFWAQAGSRHRPELNDDNEHLTVQYWNETHWKEVGNTTFDETRQAYAFELGEDASHEALKIRFKQPSATSYDPWYIDDVVVYGVNES